MKKDSLLKSSVWISLSGIISRVLAVVYIIPWNIWIGPANQNVANATYARVYNIYNLFLIIATAGIPSAISKEVAAHNSLGHYDQSEKILKKYTLYMTIIGVVIAAIMFFGANFVSAIFAAGDTRVITPIKYLSIAMLVIPALGIIRGYIQGYAFISVSAFSQVIEQIARVAYMLYATYVIMVVQNGNYLEAVNQSTLASFIGATLAYLFLLWMRHRVRKSIKATEPTISDDAAPVQSVSFGGMLKSAIPFLLVDTIMTFLQLFDQTSFSWIYDLILHASQHTIDNLYGMFGFQANKLIMVLVSLAISVSASVIPALSALVSRKSGKDKIQNIMRNIVEFTVFLILPATLGMVAIGSQLWTLFYGHSTLGTYILAVSCAEAIFYCFFMILENILQVTKHVKTSMYYLVIAYLIKIVLQVPLTVYLGAFGPLLSSTITFAVMGHFAFGLLNKEFGIVDSGLAKRLGKVAFNSIVMFVIVFVAVYGLSFVISDLTKVGATIVLSIGAIIGILIYGFLGYKNGALQILRKIRNTEIY